MNNITKIVEINDIYSEKEYEENVKKISTELGFSVSKNHPDILYISKEEKASIGIKEVQDLTSWAYTKPYNHTLKVVFITHGDLLTREAQNSLLKVTEEPPEFTNIFIFVNSHKNLLDTIVSRSQIMDMRTREKSRDSVDDFIKMSSIEKFKYCDKKAKEDTNSLNNFFNNLILHYRKNKRYELISEIIKLKELLNRNVNKKLILSNLCITIDTL